jgi:hypothetical protein
MKGQGFRAPGLLFFGRDKLPESVAQESSGDILCQSYAHTNCQSLTPAISFRF